MMRDGPRRILRIVTVVSLIDAVVFGEARSMAPTVGILTSLYLPFLGQPPDVDGVVRADEWTGARREHDIRFRRVGRELFVAVEGPARGYPSVCIGDDEQVEVLHASAALGTATYVRGSERWSLRAPFEWRLRDTGPTNPPSPAERTTFFAQHAWISTASRTGSPAREFHIRLDERRHFIGVVFLAVDSMIASYWPASVRDGCRAMALLRGEAPPTLDLHPADWQPIATLLR